MEKLYRKNYTGEFCVYERYQKKNVITETREWIPNTIAEFAHTGNALVIGNGRSRLDLDLTVISNHRGGHLGKKKLTTYGCNSLYCDFTPTFLVANSDTICEKIAASKYSTTNVTYTNAEQIIQYPGHFHLIPYNCHWNAGATATWMACFDGMKKIYLLGFDNQPTLGENSNVYVGAEGYETAASLVNDSSWISTMYDIFTTYDDVDFVWVNPVYMPEQWKYAANLRQATIRDFIVEADLGA